MRPVPVPTDQPSIRVVLREADPGDRGGHHLRGRGSGPGVPPGMRGAISETCLSNKGTGLSRPPSVASRRRRPFDRANLGGSPAPLTSPREPAWLLLRRSHRDPHAGAGVAGRRPTTGPLGLLLPDFASGIGHPPRCPSPDQRRYHLELVAIRPTSGCRDGNGVYHPQGIGLSQAAISDRRGPAAHGHPLPLGLPTTPSGPHCGDPPRPAFRYGKHTSRSASDTATSPA